MRVLRNFILVCLFFLQSFLFSSFSSIIPFVPQVVNYSARAYEGGNQNWDITHDEEGVIYVGNNRGLLEFDGINWNLYRLPGGSVVKSVFYYENRIYVGSYETFGYFERNSKGVLSYTCMSSGLEVSKNDEFKSIIVFDGNVVFQSHTCCYIYDGKNIEKRIFKHKITDTFLINDMIFGREQNGGVMKFNGRDFEEYVSSDKFYGSDVIGMGEIDGKYIFATENKGLFIRQGGSVIPFRTEADNLLKSASCHKMTIIDSVLIIGTYSNGVVAIDKDGRKLWHINKCNSMQNNTVLSMHPDKNSGIWLALDNGVSYIRMNSPVSIFEPAHTEFGMVFDLLKNDDRYFLATNQGLYTITSNGEFRKAADSNGQCWYIDNFDNQCIVGSNKGVSYLDKSEIKTFEGVSEGGVAIKKFFHKGKELLLSLSYSDFSIFEKDRYGNWQFSHNIRGFKNRIRSFEIDFNGTIWASHINKGLYKLELSSDLKNVVTQAYFPSLDASGKETPINVMTLRSRVFFADGTGFYLYDEINQKMINFDFLNENISDCSDVYKVKQLSDTLFWFIRENEYSLIKYKADIIEKKRSVSYDFFPNAPIENYSEIHIEGDMTYFCQHGLIARYDLTKEDKYNEEIDIKIKNVIACTLGCESSDTLSFRSNGNITLANEYNTVMVNISCPLYMSENLIAQYKLEGYHKDFENISSGKEIRLCNLPSGKYNLIVQVKDKDGKIYGEDTLRFKISPSIFKTWIAYVVYGIFMMILFYSLMSHCRNIREKKRIRKDEEESKMRDSEIKQMEQVVTKLENEKLEDMLSYKSKELAGATLTLISYDDFLKGIIDKLRQNSLKGTLGKKFIDSIIREMESKLVKEDEWNVFQSNFDRIHENFFRNLKDRYPDLTAGDLRMCALLRLNMPTKEVAGYLNMSVRGVESARYRIRKKIGMTEGEDLIVFLIQFN